ncbi:MAG TPA: CoA-transferase [Smithellaceae bacterium]|nr:CoA-transferase [Smithellaceae bacterium]
MSTDCKGAASANYTLQELLVAAAAREIRDNEVVFVGVGIPCLGAFVAKFTHAPNVVLVVESGCIGSMPYRLMLGIGDNSCNENAIAASSLWRAFSDQQRGYFDLGMLGGAQVDKYGNLNSTAIFGKGDYKKPLTRLPGSGGANDIACSAKRTLLMMNQQKRRFLEKVDYITSPGYLDGPGSREKYGYNGNGPSVIISNMAIFRFDEVTKEAYLDSVHPGVTVEDVKKEVSWDLKVSPNLKVTPPPTEEEVEIIHILDAQKIYTGKGLKELTFDSYIAMLEKSFVTLKSRFPA